MLGKGSPVVDAPGSPDDAGSSSPPMFSSSHRETAFVQQQHRETTVVQQQPHNSHGGPTIRLGGGGGGGSHLTAMKALHEKKTSSQDKDRILAAVTGATLQDVAEFREIFELVDLDKGGSIDADELRKLTELLNMETSEEELEGMLQEIDTTGQGEIFFPDFVRTMLKKPDVDYTKKDVQDAFHELAGRPANRYGLINATLLEERLMNVGHEHERLSKQQVEDILGMSEVDERGDIDYCEFVSLMMGDTRERRQTKRDLLAGHHEKL